MPHPPHNQQFNPPDTFPPPDDRLSPRDAADLFGITIDTMYDWIRAGYKVWQGGKTGGRYVLSRSHTLAMAERFKAKQAEEKREKEELRLARIARINSPAALERKQRGLPRSIALRELIGASDVARILGITRAKVYKMVYAGVIMTVAREGAANKSMAFRRDYIEELAKKGEIQA